MRSQTWYVTAVRYALALAGVAAAVLLRWSTLSVFKLMDACLIVYPAVVMIALLAGMGPGLVAGVFACFASEYFLAEPTHTWNHGAASWVRLAIVMFSAVGVGLLGRRIRTVSARAKLDGRAAEAVLREREERLSLATEASRLGVFEWNVPADCAIWENDRMYEIFGRTRQEGPLSRAVFFRETIHPDDADRFGRELDQAMRPGRLFTSACRIRRKSDGEWRWIEYCARFEFAADGSPQRLIGVVADIAERKAAEDVSRMTVRRFELLAHSAEQLLQSREPQKVVESLCRAVMEHLGCDVFFNYLVDDAAGKLRLNACAGIPEEQARRLEWLEYGAEVCSCAALDAFRTVPKHIPSTLDPRAELVKRFGIKAFACHPLLGPGGEVLGTLSFGTRTRETFSERDLSLMKAVTDHVASAMARIRNEDTLRKSEEESRRRAEEVQRLMEIVPAAIWVADDPQCRQITGNRRANEMYEAAAEENVSATTLPERRRFFQYGRELSPEELPMQLAAARNTDIQNYEMDVLLPSGRRMAIFGAASPLRDADGGVRGCVAAFMDITERRRTQDAVRKSEERFRLAIAAGRMGTWDWQLQSGQVDWSAGYYALLGYRVGEVKPSNEAYQRRVHPDDLERQKCELREAMEQHREYQCEYRVVWPDGSVHWVEARGQCVYDDRGTAVQMYGVLIDVDAKRRLEEQRILLLEAERAARMESEQLVRLKDEFLATVSHELRSPLSAIVGWTGLLVKGKAESGKALDIIRRSASSLTQIVEDLLDMSRIIAGKIRLKRESVDLLEVVNNVVDGIQFTAEAKSIVVKVSFDPHLVPIEADPNRIQQVIWNLLANAIKFTPEGGEVSLSVSQSTREITIKVRDTGKGIAPEFLPHIFERFRQEDGGIARKHGGLGLGLSIVKHVVELHGGTIEAKSEGEGKGATFSLSLPRTNSAANDLFLRPSFTRPLLDTAVDLDEHTLAGLKILGVDDDPLARELLVRVLADAGAEVRTVESPDQAYAVLEDFRPDLLISDVGMPGEDGYAFVQTLRSARDWRGKLPVIAVTAFGRPEDHERALRSGFDAHVCKPFDPGLLCMTLLKMVPNRKQNPACSKTAENGVGNGQGGEQAEADVKNSTAVISSALTTAPNQPRRILLAEDNEVISDMIKAALEERGYRVIVADSIAKSMSIARQSPVDLLLSDLRLKDGNGWDLLTQLHSVRRIPGIAMSGYADQAYIDRSMAAGFSRYLVKPVDTDELVRVIGTISAPDKPSDR